MRASYRALALSCPIFLSCAPSHRLIHDGDKYFERCYGADFDTRRTREQREGCWQAWVAGYTKHQPAHRVDYALRRIESLQNGEPLPQLLGEPDGGLEDAGLELPTATREPTTVHGSRVGVNGCDGYCSRVFGLCDARCGAEELACHHTCERERAFCLGSCY